MLDFNAAANGTVKAILPKNRRREDDLISLNFSELNCSLEIKKVGGLTAVAVKLLLADLVYREYKRGNIISNHKRIAFIVIVFLALG